MQVSVRYQKRMWGTVALASLLLMSTAAYAERLKDLADLEGVRPNQLVGYGIVVGLAGTGDDASGAVGIQSLLTMLKRLGANIDAGRLKMPNVAAVAVTAELPAYSQPGQKLDVTVSSLGSAASLQGGMLIATPLKGADLNVYAVAQGPVSIGGFVAGGATGTRVEKNHATVGRIPGGALVERAVPINLRGAEIRINLRRPDFTTAVRIAEAIDGHLQPKPVGTATPDAGDDEADAKGKKKRRKKGSKDKKKKSTKDKDTQTSETALAASDAEGDQAPQEKDAEAVAQEKPPAFARALTGGTVLVRIPEQYNRRLPELMATLEGLMIIPDLPTTVVVNERTGTVVLGEGVRISPVAIAHGGLTVEVSESFGVSQPGAFSSGETAVVPSSRVAARESHAYLHQLSAGASLAQVISALNALGVSPRDLVAILQTLKSSGALRAELVIQ